MPTISSDDSEWHEVAIILSLLKDGPLARKELYQRTSQIQSTVESPIGTGAVHSLGAYAYWIRHFKTAGFVEESGNILALTALGRWVAESRPGTVQERERFASLLCPQCTSVSTKVIRKPLWDTCEVNAKGTLFMNFKCPRCGNLDERHNLSGIAKKDEFLSFYNQAVTELRRYVTIDP